MSLSEFFNASKIRYHREKANEALADFNREDAEYHFGKAISLGSKDVFRDILIEHAKGNMNDDYICLVYDYIGDDKPKWFQEYEREAKTLKLKISKEQYLDSSKSIWSKSDASILYNEGNIMFLKGDYKNAEYYFVEAFKNGLAEAYGKILENSSNFSENLLDILCSWNVDLNINGDTDYITGKAFLDLYYRAVQNSSDNWTEDDTKNCLNTALEHFNSAASKGYKDAESKILEIKNLRWSSQRNMALSYFQNGQLQESVSLLTKLAKDGDSESYYILGTMLFKRVEVNKNSECVDSYMAQCVEYFLKAAEGNIPRAFMYLGFIYSDENNKCYDLSKAEYFYKQGASLGEVGSQRNLSLLYSSGRIGGQPDWDKALKYLEAAAKNGDVLSQYNMGCCYQQALGCTRNLEKAMQWWLLAAKNGQKDAIDNLRVVRRELDENSWKGIFKTLARKMVGQIVGDAVGEAIAASIDGDLGEILSETVATGVETAINYKVDS